ncbi:MAG: YfdX family protein [Halioglobus sp.]|nr:YfdX family protein [Halioglobus sp.]
MTKQPGKFTIWLLSIALLTLPLSVLSDTDKARTEAMKEATESVESDVQAMADEATGQRRKKIRQQAIDALAHTREALTALEEERVDDALEALALTTGKLELIMARDPELALAPTDVAVITHDVYASKQAIEDAIEQAEEALDDGEVQAARELLAGLGSEIIISVTNLPLATYPEAIKAVTPLIDDGEIATAKRSLQAALNTLVVTEHVVPLPILRANALLDSAEELAAKSDRSDSEAEELDNQLKAARNQLEMAELLGYGDEKRYAPLYKELESLQKKVRKGDSDSNLFDKVGNSMTRLWDSVFG